MSLVTLVSGGIDSTLMALLTKEEGIEQYPLFICYGQLSAEREWEACQRQHRVLGLPAPHYVDLTGYGKLVSSGLTDPNKRIYEDAFLPGRNLLFLLIGSAYACQVQAGAVAIGLLRDDNSLFPDQTLEFAEQAETLLRVAVQGNIKVVTPLMEFSKAEVMKLAADKNIRDTVSCHAGGEEPCGICVACRELAAARGVE